MTFTYFLESEVLESALLQVLDADSPQNARAEASDILARAADGIAIHVFEDAVPVLSIRAGRSTDLALSGSANR